MTNVSLDVKILGFCLNAEFFSQVKNTLDRDMFTREMRDIFDTLTYSHTKYGNTMTSSELAAMFDDRNPAMPDSAREKVHEIVVTLEAGNPDNTDMHLDMVRNFWLRDRARQIGEKAIEIFTGESEEFGELQRLIDAVDDGRMSDKTTYTEVDTDLDELLDEVTGDPDFPFQFSLLQGKKFPAWIRKPRHPVRSTRGGQDNFLLLPCCVVHPAGTQGCVLGQRGTG